MSIHNETSVKLITMETITGKRNTAKNQSVDDILNVNTKSQLLSLTLASFTSMLNRSSNIDLDRFCEKLRVPAGLPQDLKKQKLKEKFVAEKSKSNMDSLSNEAIDGFDQDGVLPQKRRESLENWLRS